MAGADVSEGHTMEIGARASDMKPLLNAYHAIADDNRRQMLDLLRTLGPMRAGEIVAYFPQISQPAVSKHLRVLRQAKLVRSTKSGREQWYHLNPAPLQPVAAWLEEYEALWDQRLLRLKTIAEQTASAQPPAAPEAPVRSQNAESKENP